MLAAPSGSGGGNLTVSNSSFIGNTCATDGCAIQIDGGTVELSHNTYWNNASDTSGNTSGVHGGGGTVDMLNSIIGRDTTTGGRLCGGSFNNHNSERRHHHVERSPRRNNPCGNVTVANPRLGGQTGFPPYLPLGAGSGGESGAGGDGVCGRYPIDQRGAARPDTKCDSGRSPIHQSALVDSSRICIHLGRSSGKRGPGTDHMHRRAAQQHGQIPQSRSATACARARSSTAWS